MAQTLECSIAERLDSLIGSNPAHKEALVNHLEIITRATLNDDHEILWKAVRRAANRLDMSNDARVLSAIEHVKNQARSDDRVVDRIHGHA